jgi:hypothetical protein
MRTITPANSFSSDRVLLLCKRHIAMNRKTWGIGFAAVFGLLAVMWYYPILTPGTPWHRFSTEALLSAGTFFYIGGGLFLTSFIFDELHSSSTAFLTLTLPATSLEKLVASWLVSALLFTAVSFAGYYLLTLLLFVSTKLTLTTEIPHIFHNPFGEGLGDATVTYLTYHSIFLLGAAYFKKNNFLKTALSLIILGITLFFTLAAGLFLFAFDGSSFHLNLNDLAPAIQHLIILAIIASALFATYVRLKNRQVV